MSRIDSVLRTHAMQSLADMHLLQQSVADVAVAPSGKNALRSDAITSVLAEAG